MDDVLRAIETPSSFLLQKSQHVIGLLTASIWSSGANAKLRVELRRLRKIRANEERRGKRRAEAIPWSDFAGVPGPSVSARHACGILHAHSQNVVFEVRIEPVCYPLQQAVGVDAVIVWKRNEAAGCVSQTAVSRARQTSLAAHNANGQHTQELSDNFRKTMVIAVLVDHDDIADKPCLRDK